MGFEITFVALFAVATAVALVARWIKVPYTVALVVAGLLLGATRVLEPPHLTKDLLYAVFLPGLLFEAAYHMEFRRFWSHRRTIFSLALPGVVAAMFLTAGFLVPIASALHVGFTLTDGLVFGALIAASDPVAVVGLFKSLGVPRRLAILLEGESLLNDGTAVVLFSVVLAFVLGGGTSVASAVLTFAKVVGLGLVVGAAFGLGLSKVTQQIDDPMIEITLTTIAAYGSFVVAEQFHASGVLATVTAGMLSGNYAARTGMSPSTRLAVESFWEYVAFALNSIVFLLIGFQVHVDQLVASWHAILVAFFAVLLGRALVVFVVSALIRRTVERVPWSWSAVLTWSGLRGGLSMVLVLGLPVSFAHRDLLIAVTFGVVILSILVQGLTMSPLLRRLGVTTRVEGGGAHEIHRGTLRATRAALQALDEMESEHFVHAEVADTLRAEYERRARDAEAAIQSLPPERTELREKEMLLARRRLLLAEKDQVVESARKGVLGEEASEKLLADLDARIASIEEGEGDPAAPGPSPAGDSPRGGSPEGERGA